MLECDNCKQKFVFPIVLKRHNRTHTNERPYNSQICGKSYKQLGHLTSITTHTDLKSVEAIKLRVENHDHRIKHNLFECNIRKRVFTYKYVLERHISSHSHERLFARKECGKRFKQAIHGKNHMLVHNGEKKFNCTVCEKTFNLAYSLKKHMLLHNGEKPYQCNVCEARFSEKRKLSIHIRTHTNERPHSCNVCGKS